MNQTSNIWKPTPTRHPSTRQRTRHSLLSIYSTNQKRKSSLNKRSLDHSSKRRFERSVMRVTTHPDAPTYQVSTLLVEVLYNSKPKVIEFEYDKETRIRELVQKIRVEVCGGRNGVIRSGILTVDYLMSLGHQRVSELAGQNLKLIVDDLKVSDIPQNSLKHFTILKCIGSGGFSKVYMAECYGVYVALKIINKQKVVQTQKHSIIQNQKSILLQHSQHPFITKLHFSIQTQSTITFALQFCSGGQLFHLLKRLRRMSQHQARFYFLQVLSALISLHQNHIVYRDLKPQNIVIDSDGHVRLADFGLSKRCEEGVKNTSFCGSAEYMAPEMIERREHGVQLDVYCLGALLYQLVTGLPPFFSRQSEKMFYNIVNQEVMFPPDVALSKNAKKLMINLLSKDPSQRMTATEILKDPWVKGATLEYINAKKLSPPFKPNLLSYNFDDGEFAASESDDLLAVYQQREIGDLVLPLFRKFYYESDYMKLVKQKLMKPIQNEFLTKKSPLRKVSLIKLRTESNSSLTSSKLKRLHPKTPLKQRQLQSPTLKQAKQSSSGWLFKALQQQKHLLQKPPPLKKSLLNKQLLHKLYAAR